MIFMIAVIINVLYACTKGMPGGRETILRVRCVNHLRQARCWKACALCSVCACSELWAQDMEAWTIANVIPQCYFVKTVVWFPPPKKKTSILSIKALTPLHYCKTVQAWSDRCPSCRSCVFCSGDSGIPSAKGSMASQFWMWVEPPGRLKHLCLR